MIARPSGVFVEAHHQAGVSAQAAPVSKLEPFEPYLNERLQAGVWNARVLLRELKERNYQGGYTLLKDWLRPQRESARVLRLKIPHPSWGGGLQFRPVHGIGTPAGEAEVGQGIAGSLDSACRERQRRAALGFPPRFRSREQTRAGRPIYRDAEFVSYKMSLKR